MNKFKIIGVLWILVTWIIAILSYNGLMPYLSDFEWTTGLAITIISSMIGVYLYFSKVEKSEQEDVNKKGDENNRVGSN